MNRRSFLTGLIAAPAVIRVAPLMRIVPVPLYGVGPIMLTIDDTSMWHIFWDRPSVYDIYRNLPVPFATGLILPKKRTSYDRH